MFEFAHFRELLFSTRYRKTASFSQTLESSAIVTSFALTTSEEKAGNLGHSTYKVSSKNITLLLKLIPV